MEQYTTMEHTQSSIKIWILPMGILILIFGILGVAIAITIVGNGTKTDSLGNIIPNGFSSGECIFNTSLTSIYGITESQCSWFANDTQCSNWGCDNDCYYPSDPPPIGLSCAQFYTDMGYCPGNAAGGFGPTANDNVCSVCTGDLETYCNTYNGNPAQCAFYTQCNNYVGGVCHYSSLFGDCDNYPSSSVCPAGCTGSDCTEPTGYPHASCRVGNMTKCATPSNGYYYDPIIDNSLCLYSCTGSSNQTCSSWNTTQCSDTGYGGSPFGSGLNMCNWDWCGIPKNQTDWAIDGGYNCIIPATTDFNNSTATIWLFGSNGNVTFLNNVWCDKILKKNGIAMKTKSGDNKYVYIKGQ